MDSKSGKASELRELVEVLAKQLSMGADEPSSDHRSLAEDCLEAIAGSGFEIRAGEDRQVSADSKIPDPHAADTQQMRTRDLIQLWRHYSGKEAAGSAKLYQDIGNRLLESAEPLLAYDVLQSGLRHYPKDLRLRQLTALALARSSAPQRAAKRLQELVEEGHQDEETLSLLARTCKDLWESELDPAKRQQHLQQSHSLYRQGYEAALVNESAGGLIYAGVNAATTALLLGDTEFANSVAAQVATVCRQQSSNQPDYWAMATLGECALIVGNYDEAKSHYSAATQLADGQYANIASTRRNAEIILRYQDQDKALLAECFNIPSVAVFSGHMIDRPGRPQRFPHSEIESVRNNLKQVLQSQSVGFGYAAAACGSDLLFLQELEASKGETHIVLPLAEEQFLEASISIDPDYDWRSVFDVAMDAAAQVTIVNDFSKTADALHFEYANRVMTGLAILHAHSLSTDLVPICVWDQKPAVGPGGTGSVVALWRSLGFEPHVISPNPNSASEVGEADDLDVQVQPFEKDIRALLFADVVGYSKITEEEIPIFVREFMGRLAKCVEDSGVQVETTNTWGDAIYFVFRSVEEAGLTALMISEFVNATDWESLGLRNQLNLRTGLHVGPVYKFIDPLTHASTHTGAHVSRAARIEPITPPGEVYASEAFAAVAAAENVKTFECDYVGITPMAKGYGDFATYHVRRKSD